MRRPASFNLLLLLGAATLPRSAAAEDPPPPAAEPPVAIAVMAGAATAFIPLVLGGVRAATASSPGARNIGYTVGGVGPALSPIVAHAVLGEWARAAAFGAPTVASEIGLSAYLAANPDAVFNGTVGSRTAFAIIFSIDLFGAAFGLVDVMMARERWLERQKKGSSASLLRDLTISPRVGGGQVGLALGGAL